MGTEEDKTNNGVLITLFVMGAAAMLGGSAAIVGMTRTEMDAQSAEGSAYADLESVRELAAAQHKELSDSELPIAEARQQMLADIQRNPVNASWATPSPTDETPAAGGTGGASAGGASAGGAASTGGAANDAAGGEATEAAGGAATAPPGEATAPVPSAPSPKTPPEQGDPKPAPSEKPTPSEKRPPVPETSTPTPNPAPAPTQ